MIGGALRLLVLYVLVWLIGTHWDGVANAYQQTLLLAAEQLPLLAWADLPVAFALTVCIWQLPWLWCWLLYVPVNPELGPIRHPFAVAPLRLLLRLRPSRPLAAMVATLLGLVVALRSLEGLALRNLPPALWVDPVLWAPWDGMDDSTQVWFNYTVAHGLFAVLGWLLVQGPARMAAGAAKARLTQGSFARYHLTRRPVLRLFFVVLFLGHLPVAAFTATSHPHPLHALVTVASLCALLAVAALGQLLTLWVESRHDRWLIALTEKARAAGANSPAYLTWQSSQRFLIGRFPESLAPTGAGTSPETPSSHSDSAEPSRPQSSASPHDEGGGGPADSGTPDTPTLELTAFRVLAEGRVELERGHHRRARRLLSDAVGLGDQAVRQQAEALLNTMPGYSRRYLVAGGVLVLALAGGAGVVVWQWAALPGADQTRQLARSAHIHLRKRTTDGDTAVQLLGTRYDYSLNIGLQNISPHFVDAVVASEDHRFYEHGVAYKLIKFAQAGVLCVANKLKALSSARPCRGNSTLPQQLARNLFLSEKRSIRRKLAELLWALKMEAGLSKEEILEFYMNRIYLGNGNFGVEMAARDYFHKSAANLTLTESAYLAAAIKRPSWNWHQNRAQALERGQLILSLMKRHGYAPANADLTSHFKPRLGNRRLYKPYLGHLWQWAKDEVRIAMQGLPDGDYKVLTSLNAEVEVYAELGLYREIGRLQSQGLPVNQGATVVMRPSGEVLAMVGGIGTGLSGRGTNRAKRTAGLLPRPPASAFKPFVYLAALEMGLRPDSTIDASPVEIALPGSREVYRPQNHDGRAYGRVTMRQGLVDSINTAAVHLLHRQVGYDRLFDTVDRLGIKTDGLRRQWGLALGQSGVPLIEMVGAYAVFANGGQRVDPHAVLAITTEFGKTVWRRPPSKLPQVFSRQDISDLNRMLREVVSNGTGRRAAGGLPPEAVVAGKTGTGDDFVDAWFIGYTADLVIGVWLGNDRPVQMPGVYGGTGPARAFNGILGKLVKHTDLTEVTAKLP